MAVHASQIQIVGRLPVQNVIIGDLYSFESCSKYIHGLLSGRRWVFPISGKGNGPGGCRILARSLSPGTIQPNYHSKM